MRLRAGRRTNLGVLLALVGAFGSGWLAFATARPPASVLAAGLHGAFGLGLVLVAPWKTVVVRRAPGLRPWSLVLLVVVVVGLAAGFVELLGGYGVVAGLSPIQVHVGAAFALVPLVGWHVLRHRRMRPRRSDLSRRSLLRSAAFVGGAVAGTAALTGGAVALSGGTRVGTGSRPVAEAISLETIPPTIWLLDPVPLLDPATHRVLVDGTAYDREQLESRAGTVTARLDCTSGWYADAAWTGVPLADLLDPDRLRGARSIAVSSVTGFVRTFPVALAADLWLATGCQGRRLDLGHGAPVRLVAPGHRGFWWVKWVASVELRDAPSWRQLPFPV